MKRLSKLSLLLLVSIIMLTGSIVPAFAADETPIVLEIAVKGNGHVDTETILEAISETKVGEPLDVDKANEDLFNIYALGYFFDVVAGIEPIVGTRDGARLVIEVFEFPVLEDISIESEGVPSDVVRGWMTTSAGQVLNQVDLENDVAVIQDKAVQEYGVYLRPAVLDLDEENDVLLVHLKAARVADVSFTGNEKTKDHVIQREITIKPGDLLERQQVQRTLQRLSLLGYFADVGARFVETDGPDELAVVIELEERKTGLASFGAGYSSLDGFVGYIEVADENFLGNGQRTNLRWEFGKRKNSYDLGFHEPYLFGSRTSFGINLFNTRTERTQKSGTVTTVRESGGDISLGRPLGEYTRGFITYNHSDWHHARDGVAFKDGKTRSVTLSANTDTRNHAFSPTEGFRTRFAVERAGGILGGTDHFTKYDASYSTYFQIGSKERQAFAVRAMYGQGASTDGTGLPEHHRFRVGGPETLRGYNYGNFEGDRMLVFNTEFRFPIANAVEGVVFADFGNTFAHDEGVDLRSLKAGYGVGVRLDTPLGMMRIDYGIGEDGGRTYFSLGPAF